MISKLILHRLFVILAGSKYRFIPKITSCSLRPTDPLLNNWFKVQPINLSPSQGNEKSCDPVGYTYQSNVPVGSTYQSIDPVGSTYQSSALEGYTYQSSAPEGYTTWGDPIGHRACRVQQSIRGILGFPFDVQQPVPRFPAYSSPPEPYALSFHRVAYFYATCDSLEDGVYVP
ncbi:NBS-LRR type resistance protein [Cucumis melo var. makuwa]|uniref:NBS-LRR type resistance protein n=1 Tax=Cucumis melo var. makuwa TaxID=1194695 RepID=A0A5A7SUP9_CUCMM|nr:NBS-LRR type resistance protein [Cucumis melo var. makuwa]TYK21307.1 NBS-LRR type resistance protein [Cucumis melo var. makuwa]